MGNSIFSIPEICLGIAVCNLLKKLPVRFGESAVINLLNPAGKTAAQDEKVYLSHDNGYTYGGITASRFEEVERETENE